MPLNFWVLILIVSLEPLTVGFSWIVLKQRKTTKNVNTTIQGRQPYTIFRSLVIPLLFLSPTWWIPGLFALLPPLTTIYPFSLVITITWFLINIKIGYSFATIIKRKLNYFNRNIESTTFYWFRRIIGLLTTLYYVFTYIQIIQYLISSNLN